VYAEKDFEDFAKRDHGRIKRDLNDFGMPGRTRADPLVRRLGDVSARISRFDLRHTLELLENGFETPKATAAERREFIRHVTSRFCRLRLRVRVILHEREAESGEKTKMSRRRLIWRRPVTK